MTDPTVPPAAKNERAESIMGLRRTDGIAIDQPCELDYHCPICVYEQAFGGNFDERLEWSEYNGFLWCSVCNRDYPSALCMPDPVRATAIFLDTVAALTARQPLPATDDLAAREAIADTMMDLRMSGPWSETATYQEAMRHYADVLLALPELAGVHVGEDAGRGDRLAEALLDIAGDLDDADYPAIKVSRLRAIARQALASDAALSRPAAPREEPIDGR